MAGKTPALEQNWQSSEKSQHFKKKTQYLITPTFSAGSAIKMYRIKTNKDFFCENFVTLFDNLQKHSYMEVSDIEWND